MVFYQQRPIVADIAPYDVDDVPHWAFRCQRIVAILALCWYRTYMFCARPPRAHLETRLLNDR